MDADGDQDGLTDAFEKLAGTSLTVADSDADGLSDGYEALKSKTDPLAADTDEDGMDDAQEISTGGDAGSLPGVAGVVGVGALAENVRNGITDTDADGLSDHAEEVLRTDAAKADSDADSLSDAMEVAIGSNPLLADTDNDGMGDAVEVQYGMDPLAPGSALGAGVPGAGVGGPGVGQPLPEPQPADVGRGLRPVLTASAHDVKLGSGDRSAGWWSARRRWLARWFRTRLIRRLAGRRIPVRRARPPGGVRRRAGRWLGARLLRGRGRAVVCCHPP